MSNNIKYGEVFKIVKHKPLGSWYTVVADKHYFTIQQAPISTTNEDGFASNETWCDVSDLADLSVKEYEDLRQLLNREFPNMDIDNTMYRCL